MLGNEMGYDISTCQMQYDANNKETDQKSHASYPLEGTVLENVERIKYLGVTITNDLRWNTHVTNIRCHDLPERAETDRNGPKRTSSSTETDRNRPKRIGTNRNGLTTFYLLNSPSLLYTTLHKVIPTYLP